MTNYPNNLDDSSSLPIATSGAGGGSAPDATSTVKGILKLTNDLSGTAALPSVVKIQGKSISTTAPTDGQVLTWDNALTEWKPTTPVSVSVVDATTSVKGIIQLAGDISGTATSITVSKIQNRAVESTAPADKEVLTWVTGTNQWEAKSIPTATPFIAGSIQLAGDLGGTYDSPTVLKINGQNVSSLPPSIGQVLTWSPDTEWQGFDLPVATNTTYGGIILTRDLGDGYDLPKVVGLQGRDVSSLEPTNGQVLTWSFLGNNWEPKNLPNATADFPGIINLSGDLAGTYSSPKVVAIQNYLVQDVLPTDGQVLTWSDLNTQWEPTDPLSVVDATTLVKGIIQLAGDLAGTAASPTVAKINGYSVLSTAPTSNQVLTWDGLLMTWYPADIPPQPDATTLSKGLVQLAGDLSGTASSPTVSKLRGYSISTTPPTEDYALLYNGGEYVTNFIDGYSDLSLLAGIRQLLGTEASTFTSIGSVSINASYYTGSIFIFECILQATSGQTAQIQLYNLTDGSVVSGSGLSTTNTSPTLLSTTVSLSGSKVYEAQIKISNASPSSGDGLTASCAKIRVKYI